MTNCVNCDALNRRLKAISDWIDEYPRNQERSPEARMWGRVAKLSEEVGEAMAAMVGLTGQNPRKDITHDLQDLEAELLDVALTALAAWVHVSVRSDPLRVFGEHMEMVVNRVGLEVEE